MIDWFIVVGYLVVMLYVGWRSRAQSAEGYWVAGRRYATARITASLVATIFGASSTMGIIGLGYGRGLTGAWWALIGGIALVPLAFFFAAKVHRLNVYTLPDILKRAYGDTVAIPAGVMISVAWCGVVAAQMIAGARLVGQLFTLDFELALIAVALVFTLYTFWGGQLSVIRTDLWQFLLFMGGLLIGIAFLLAPEGPRSLLWEQIPADHLRFPISAQFGWYDLLVFYPLIVGLPYLVGPDIYSRIFCAGDDQVARRSTLLAAAIVIPLALLLAFFGVLARGRFPGIPPEAALPHTLNALIPPGLKGVITAGFLGAIMSSADTCLLSAATILTLNVIDPVLRLSQPGRLMLTRILVLFLGAAACLVASRQREIIASLLLGYTVFVGGVVLPTLAAFLKPRLHVTSAGAFWAVVVGGGAALLAKIHGGAPLQALLPHQTQLWLAKLLGPRYPSLLPIVLCLFVMLGVSYVGKSDQRTIAWRSAKKARGKRK
jgi:SSS family solute:Na+ symporter